jgi:hypothetical protein
MPKNWLSLSGNPDFVKIFTIEIKKIMFCTVTENIVSEPMHSNSKKPKIEIKQLTYRDNKQKTYVS